MYFLSKPSKFLPISIPSSDFLDRFSWSYFFNRAYQKCSSHRQVCLVKHQNIYAHPPYMPQSELLQAHILPFAPSPPLLLT